MSVIGRAWRIDDDPGRFDPQSRYWTESEDTANMARDAGATVVEYAPIDQLRRAVGVADDAIRLAEHLTSYALPGEEVQLRRQTNELRALINQHARGGRP